MPLTLEQLPDDVLVMVMQHLSVDDLFACRLVCKRLSRLAVHRDVWRHQLINVHDRCVCAVLQLAPCAETIVYRSKKHCSQSATTRCAAAGLELYVGEDFNAAECAMIVRKQEQLGRLRSVRVEQFAPTCQTRAELLLRTLASCSVLERLDVEDWYDLSSGLMVSRPHLPTSNLNLKYFRCQLNKKWEPFVNAVLAGHAASLEEVHLDEGHLLGDHIAASTAALLSAMPKLRELSCNALYGMAAVARCATLRDVELTLWRNVKEVVQFLARATQLRTITLQLDGLVAEGHDWFCEELVDSLGSLAATSRPLLEQLSISSLPEVVKPLVRALPWLPGLRRLLVSDISLASADKLLLGITAATAPALRLLQLNDQTGYDEEPRNANDWIQADAVEKALCANPSLHILLILHNDVDSDGDSVASNRSYCIGLHSHDPDGCPSPEDHPLSVPFTDMKVRWIHVPRNSV